MRRLQDKVAIVTGGANGIGEATVKLFAAEGARVVVADVDSRGDGLAQSMPGRASFVRLDVSQEDEWKSCVRTVMARWGRIDILVNNAAKFFAGNLLDTSKEIFETILSVNLLGAFLGIKAVAPVMIDQSHGSIVNVSSNAGIIGGNGFGAYSASKFGLRGITKAAAFELGRNGIRVNSVHPGSTNTGMLNPAGKSPDEMNQSRQYLALPRVAEPAEIANLILFVASDEASYSTGTEFVSDGGAAAGRYYEGGPTFRR
jgi:3alpha(or 20beta)-hydroxysteroid dehydrogenase